MFKSMKKNQLNRKIIFLQTYNEGEYIRNEFKKFLNDNDITHRLSCPHTHEQVGIAERKRRHIVDMGLGLLDKASLPLNFGFMPLTQLFFLLIVLHVLLMSHLW